MYWLNRLGIRTGRYGNLPSVSIKGGESVRTAERLDVISYTRITSTAGILQALPCASAHSSPQYWVRSTAIRYLPCVTLHIQRKLLVLLQYVLYYVCQHLWFVIKCWVYRDIALCILYVLSLCWVLSLVWTMEIYVSKWRTDNFKLGHLRCVLQSYKIG